MSDTLTGRALGRATLARQLLLERSPLDAAGALEHLVGLQAQAPDPPYFALWSRLAGFRPEHLSTLIEERRAVRIPLMRSTIHLVTAEDAQTLRPLVQPAIDRQVSGSYGRVLGGLPAAAIAKAALEALSGGPLTLAAIGERLAQRWPDRDPRALANAARAAVPMVQVPPRGLWGRSGPAAHVPAEAWLGSPIAGARSGQARALERLVLRYLGAFGPASVMDAQKWSGLTRLDEVFDAIRPRLRTFRDDVGRELFDLEEAPRPPADTPAPLRFLAEFDNLLLSHDDRTRVLPDRHRPKIIRGGMILGAVLVDGHVAGSWKVGLRGSTAVLRVEPFESFGSAARAAIEEEGARLLAFAAPGAPGEVVLERS